MLTPEDGKDRRGVIIQVGDYVAYNMSGQVAYGVVRDIKERKKYGKPYFMFEIEGMDDDPHPAYMGNRTIRGNVSKVSSPKNILVVTGVPYIEE